MSEDWKKKPLFITETPWRGPDGFPWLTIHRDPNYPVLCYVPCLCIEEAMPVAEKIVTACNAHDDLLAACKSASVYMAGGIPTENTRIREQLKDAIKKAEPEGSGG